jgi:hypothetical protein
MPRIRTIDPHFPRTPSLSRVSREARLFLIRLWTLADDSGRLRLDHEDLKEQLYPHDDDAPLLMPAWIGELEGARLIELYRLDDIEYLRVRRWRQLQSIDRPTPSRLPRSPSEPAREPREAREESPRIQTGRATKAIPREDGFFEEGDVALPGTPGEFPPERVLEILEIALRKSLATDAQTATARYIELAGRNAGLWGGQGAPAGRKEPADPEMSPSPATLMGLPRQRSGA